MARAGGAALGFALLAALTGACGAGTGAVQVSGPAAGPGPGAPAATTPQAPDRLAPSSYRPVLRNGRQPRPGVAPVGRNAGQARAVTYKDGLTVRIDRVTQSVEQGQGPGVYPGRPHTALHLTLVNRSTKAVDLGKVVVVTARYGTPARLAPPVYEDPAARDFAGVVKPGASTTAVYVFSVPAAAVGSVVAVVDIDGVHVPAQLKAGA
jgi:hypothetical protein